MFTITEEPFESATILKLGNPNGSYFTAIPSCGACTHELVLEKHGQLFSVLFPESSPEPLLAGTSFKGSKLTPFPNRINNGTYAFEGKTFILPINFKDGNSIHGLLYNKTFTIKETSATKDEAHSVLAYDYVGDVIGFPFPFIITITHSLTQEGIAITTEVKNTGTQDMPYGDGWHPYFTLGKKIDDLGLTLPVTKKIAVNERMIPTGKIDDYTLFSTARTIGKETFDTGFAVQNPATTLLTDGNMTIAVWQDASYPYLQVYTPKHREAIAIEPMSCMTDAFNNKKGLVVIKPGETWTGRYGVRME
jgi:aldose 1-epimerase